ncbi:hypothetical protein N5863_29095 (plasmid) [Klebsiella pasteurii]|uniref:hypothetical protein n=1 Tax=Klebsiella pasteurii TaxID=2587529 RepID=UPI0025427D1C|nr:hypothetical protein [Klebsiella pasteurii]WII85177.1 hypothetical protein N5863_29095 [Klebsiella pasteurii]
MERYRAWYRQLDATLQAERQAALAALLARAGFTAGQVLELQWHHIRWRLIGQEEAERREMNSQLDDLERLQLYCRRDQLVNISVL